MTNIKMLSAMKEKTLKKSGFTLIELMVTVLIASIVLLGIGSVIADATKGYRQMYDRIHGDIVNDAYVARLKFDKVCRMARAGTATVGTSPPTLTVLYYSTPNLTGGANLAPDSSATFSLSGTNLVLNTISGGVNTTETVARNVTKLQFSEPIGGKSVQMVMTLDKNPEINSDYSITVTCGSIMHN